MLMKFPSFLRVVVSSANLSVADWVYWSQCVWFKDFKLKSSLPLDYEAKKKTVENVDFDYNKDFKEVILDLINFIVPPKKHKY